MMMIVSTLSGQGGPPPNLEGSWLGSLEVGPGVKLRLAFHIAKSAQGDLTGTFDSLDQGAKGLPLAGIKLNGLSVAIELKAPAATYTGTLNSDATELTGNWNQGPASLPLNLKKVDAVPALDRPQEPKGPFPYRAEDVTYPSKAEGVQLAATLTIPEGGGPFPAVLLITGSGAQDRDETLLGHKPFLLIADFLTRRGIAVLRVDDRGTAKSTGNFGSATTADFVEDAAGSLAYLKARKEIDPKHIGVIGHSEGAVIAPILATGSNGVAFVVMMAGTAVRGSEVLKAQAAAIMRAGGASDSAIADNVAVQEQLFTLADPKLDAAQLQARKQTLEQSLLTKLPEDQRAGAASFLHGQVEGAATPWMRYFIAYDPAPALRALKVPVLVLNGSLDLQVPPVQNLPAIVKALERGGNSDYEVVKFPGLNHLFQTAKTGSPAEYAQIPETMAPVVLETMATWIQKHSAAK
jgi:pimeloyl-ACP methyl ester carboxylesterase